MDKQLEKIEAEPDQDKRIMMLIQYIIERGSAEDKNRAEDILRTATA
jgi:hypothetical protein